MKLLILGDVHGNTGWAQAMVRWAKNHACDAIVQLGDFGIWPGVGGDTFLRKLSRTLNENELSLYFVDGNHEDFPKLERLRGERVGVVPLIIFDGMKEGVAPIYHIPRGHVWTWGDVRFMGLGGAVSIDKRQRTPGRSWWPQETITPSEYSYALKQAQEGVDVLLTHDAPSNVPMSIKQDPESAAHRQIVSDVAKVGNPTLWFHGHMHKYLQYEFGYPPNKTIVYGLNRDEGRNSWAILELPSLTVTTLDSLSS